MLYVGEKNDCMSLNKLQLTKPTIHIALADDHTLVRRGIMHMIHKHESCKVIMEADNGLQLIDQLKRAVQLPDICILDIDMPGLNGYETAKQIHKYWPEIKIMTLTIFFSEYSVIRMLQSGVKGYVCKDRCEKDLIDAIHGVYANEYFYPENVAGIVSSVTTNKKYQSSVRLTRREEVILKALCTEKSYTDIAKELFLSVRTVESHRDNLLKKLGKKSRTGLVVYALSSGMI